MVNQIAAIRILSLNAEVKTVFSFSCFWQQQKQTVLYFIIKTLN